MPKAAIHKKSRPHKTKTKTKSKTKSKASRAPKSVKKAPVKATKEVKVTEAKVEMSSPPPAPTKRRTPNRETVIAGFDELIESVEQEIQRLREGPTKTKGVKFLRSLNKNVKLLRNKAVRVMKQKHKTGRTNNKNSGFLKPVAISHEMAKFTGWDHKELKSRVEVTKYICDYIKKHDLQNPEDRRQIKPDAKLQKLLGYNPRKNKEPLRYYSLQTHLKRHFPKKE